VEKFINTDRYIPTSPKLQTALCATTVSIEAPRSGQADLNFKNRQVFLRTLYKVTAIPIHVGHIIRHYIYILENHLLLHNHFSHVKPKVYT
jgi:hypothetical protein